MSRQAEKYGLGMAGEFFVAAQLQRLGLSAAVTYGNAKKADVVVYRHEAERAIVVEVKATCRNKWPVGGRAPAPSNQPWVFVWLPDDATLPPEFYVLSQRDLHELLQPGQEKYFAAYEARHGEPYGDRPGVISLTRTQAAPYRDNWQVIQKAVGL